MRRAVRVIGVETLQNFPISFGLVYALHAETWLSRLALMGVGALGTAALIAATERIKLAKSTKERPADLVVNALSFFAAEVVYLGYYVMIRSNARDVLLVDAAGGALLGALVGIVQAFLVDERRITRQAIAHTGGFMLAGILVTVILGAVALSWSPLVASIVLCLVMTAIIVLVDYRSHLASGHISEGRKTI